MPGYDSTGPIGHGTMTGRGQGFCITDDPAILGSLLASWERGIGRGLKSRCGGPRGGRHRGSILGRHRRWQS